MVIRLIDGVSPNDAPVPIERAHAIGRTGARGSSRFAEPSEKEIEVNESERIRHEMRPPRTCRATSRVEGADAVLLLGRAGWRTTAKLDAPSDVTPIFLPFPRPN